jgi:D-alanyl-D-alanine carboxypeptidase
VSDHPAVANLSCALNDFVSKLGALGVWVAIDAPGKPRTHVTAGRRRIDGDDPIEPGDLYQIGSQTKMLTAITMLMLARDGMLSLNDKVVDLVDLPIDPRVTVKHLIMNTSGLGEYTSGMGWPDIDPAAVYTARELYTLARPQGQPGLPGQAFDYCNTGWVAAAMIADELAPRGWTRFVRERIFQPLNLRNSYLWAEDVPMERLARGYLRLPRGLFDTGETGLSWAYGAGDAISCHDDMIDLYRALLADKNAIGVTMKDLTAELAKPSPSPRFALSLGAEYGYGVERRFWGGRPLWGHPGRTPGYAASTWCDPDNGVVVSTAFTNVWDETESPALGALRYNGPQLFTLAIMTAYAIAR